MFVVERTALETVLETERAAHTKTATERDRLAELNAKLEAIIAEIRRAHFGRKSERIDDNQFALALEDLETAAAKLQAEAAKAAGTAQTKRTPKPRTPRAEILAGLPREEVVIEPESTICSCCNGALHKIGEDTSERLDKIPAQLRVIVTKRPKYACRNCEKNGADDVAGVMVSKYADHLPFYRQSQIIARHAGRMPA